MSAKKFTPAIQESNTTTVMNGVGCHSIRE